MKKVKYIFTIFYRLIWLAIQKITGKHIVSKGLFIIPSSSDIQLSREGKLIIGSRVKTEKYCLLAIRERAMISLGNGVYMNRNCIIVAHKEIRISDNVTIGPNCCFYDHDHDISNKGSFISEPIIIENNVWIGANCLILKGVTIGCNSVIGAGSVVTKNIPRNSILIQKRENSIIAKQALLNN